MLKLPARPVLMRRLFVTPAEASAGEATGRVATAMTVAGVLVCLLLVGAGAAWRLSGGSWAVITTPSMGTAAPVGTLILTRTVPLHDLRIGDVVTYRPRNEPDKRYTHRVVHILPTGEVQVRGDINGAADPLPVGQADLVGRVVVRWRGVGWVVRALPVLLLAGVVVIVATGMYVPDRWRSSVRIIASCLLFALVALLLRPFVHPVLMAVTDHGDGSIASVVSGGVFPTRVTGTPGHSIVLHTGQTGTVAVTATKAGGPVTINGSPDLHGWWLAGAIAFCLLPLAWCLLIGLTPHHEVRIDAPDSNDEADAGQRVVGA